MDASGLLFHRQGLFIVMGVIDKRGTIIHTPHCVRYLCMDIAVPTPQKITSGTLEQLTDEFLLDSPEAL